MDVNTHKSISAKLCGTPLSLAPCRSTVRFVASPEMRADDADLAHGGFIFGLADYAAMLAVNHPFVVLGSAESTFLKPVRVGDILIAEAVVREESGRKRLVDVTVRREETEVFNGRFTCFVLDGHVLGPAEK